MGIDLGRSKEKKKESKGLSANLHGRCGVFLKKHTCLHLIHWIMIGWSTLAECINLGGCIGYIAYVCMYLLLNILKTI